MTHFLFVNYQDIFEIGSITKVFTANILAKSVIDNKIKLNENINDYLNIKFKNDTSISFKSLANHTRITKNAIKFWKD